MYKRQNPAKASLPFDRDRRGFVLGEGAGALVLESLEHARKRSARILGEVVGYGATCDAFHITAPDPSGAGAARAMQAAIDEAGVAPSAVAYINAHGTATKANDSGEAKAIRQVFGADSKVRVSSTKGMTGHLLGSAGAIEAVITVAALDRGELPENVGCFNQDPECPVQLVNHDNQSAPDARYAISNSFGFGGHNAVLAFRKWGD